MKTIILAVTASLVAASMALPHHLDSDVAGSEPSRNLQSNRGFGRPSADEDNDDLQSIDPTFSIPASQPTTDGTSSTPIRAPAPNPDADPAMAPSAGRGSGDDYPYRGKCSGLDEFRFNACQCTSFVAWRLNQNGVRFDNNYMTSNGRWGNANNW